VFVDHFGVRCAEEKSPPKQSLDGAPSWAFAKNAKGWATCSCKHGIGYFCGSLAGAGTRTGVSAPHGLLALHVTFVAKLIGSNRVLEHRNEVVFFLVKLAVDGAEDVFDFAAGDIGGDAPAE
jgi:hypothetical protein